MISNSEIIWLRQIKQILAKYKLILNLSVNSYI